MDSPGYCAQFCTYTTMDNGTKDIVNVEIIDKRECQLKSVNMEKLGFVKTMEELKKKGVTVVEVVTDAHCQIIATVSKYFNFVSTSISVH